jgi:flagellar L-ring protein precursor FlgH
MNALIKPRCLSLSFILVAVLSITGCFSNKKPLKDDPKFAPTVAPSVPVVNRTAGSLYQEAYGMSLFNDRKALNVGDVITITLSERTVSRKSAGVNVKKSSNNSLSTGRFLDMGLGSLSGDIEQTRDFKGDSDADQSNSLQGNITVTVAEVLPNGNLIVRGEKWITLNRGDEFIRISGIVRAEDISPDNTIISTRLADARISYSGSGELAEAQRMGWLTRFFNNVVWPI